MKNFFIGIDVSKKTFDAVAIKAEGLQELMERKHGKFQNNADGFKALMANGTNKNHTPNAVEAASYGNLTIAGLTNKKQLTNQN